MTRVTPDPIFAAHGAAPAADLHDADRASARKKVSTAIARAAILGIVLHDLLDDRGRPEYVATMGACTRNFGGDLDAVCAWLDRIAGKAVVS